MTTFTSTRRQALAGGAGLAVLSAARPSLAATETLAQKAEAVLASAIERTGAPGAAVAIVTADDILLATAKGVRKLGTSDAMAPDTLFSIASCSKSITSATLATLVEAGKLNWSDRVTQHLPGFALSDARVTEDFRVEDLLFHWSGLSLGAGDLMIWPRTTHSRAEIVAGLRHLPLVAPFRSQYAYDNLLYIVAGEVGCRAAGKPFEDVIRDQLFLPLGFRDSEVLSSRARQKNIAWGHSRVTTTTRGVGPIVPLPTATGDSDNAVGAGGLALSIRDTAEYLRLMLRGGKLMNGNRLWSEDIHAKLIQPRIITRVGDGPTPERPDRPIFSTYAMGWEVSDYRDRKLVWHGGYVQGGMSCLCLLPGAGIGIALLTNSEEGALTNGLRDNLLDLALGIEDRDWVDFFLKRNAGRPPQTVDTPQAAGQAAQPLSAYVGTYRDAWYGDIVVAEADGGLTIDFTKSIGMKGPLLAQGGDAFISLFPDRNLENARAVFTLTGAKVTGMRLERFNPKGDFSYDYQDLHPVKV